MDLATPRRTDPRTLPRLAVALVVVVVPASCLWKAFELLFTLFGESPTAAEHAAADRWLLIAAVTGVLGPLVGLALSVGRRGATWGFGTALLLGLVLAVAAAPDLLPTGPSAPAPVGCQEHSGPPATCPGG